MDAAAPPDRLRARDYAILGLLCGILFGSALIDGRILSIHETIHCQNVREMIAGGDWLIPSYGGRIWLERPPLPHWLTALPALLTGHPDTPWAMMLGSIAMGSAIVFMVAALAARWFGRTIGLLSGAIHATTQEIIRYATGPECDIFLCGIVTGALTLFAASCIPGPRDARRSTFFGSRPWSLFWFFVLLGLVNMAKGLFFGMIHIALPILGWMAWNRDAASLRRLIWFWGWLAFVVAAAAWPAYVYWRVPDVVELWWSDYAGRTLNGYLREPWWYYFANVPWMLFPWTLLALGGLKLTARAAWTTRLAPERFVWVWALLPVLFFSLLQGKHHHYLLAAVAPWSILAAQATLWFWMRARENLSTWRQPAWSLLVIGVPGLIAMAFVRHRLAEPAWLLPALAGGWLVLGWGLWWAVGQRDGRIAFGAGFGLLTATWLFITAYTTQLRDRYRPDLQFLQRVAERTTDAPLYVLNDWSPLAASWVLFYLDRPAELLHNDTFLHDARIADVAYVIADATKADTLQRCGTAEMLDRTEATENRRNPNWALYRVRFDSQLKRVDGRVHISPGQAAGRLPGPFLQ